jgi:epsilon-lactone hydrolase
MSTTVMDKEIYQPSKEVLEVNKHWENNAKQMGSVEEAREFSEKEWTKLAAEPKSIDYIEVDAGGVGAMWIIPKNAVADRVILCIHGGGYFAGSMFTHRKLFAHLAKTTGCRALNIDYRRSPEHQYPAQLDDVITAYRWLLDQGIEAGHIALIGDSAGGGLTIAGLLRIRDEKLPMPAAGMTISAWLDLTMSGETHMSNYEKDVLFRKEMCEFLVQILIGPDGDRKNPYISPVFSDPKGLPPIYLQAGGDETLLADSQVFGQVAKKAGVDVRVDVFPKLLHTFQMTIGYSAEARDAIDRFADWVKPKLGLV